MRNFIIFNVFVIQNEELGHKQQQKYALYLYAGQWKNQHEGGNIGLNLFDLSAIEIDQLEQVKKILIQINVVLNTLIPKLKIEIKNYGKETLENSSGSLQSGATHCEKQQKNSTEI